MAIEATVPRVRHYHPLPAVVCLILLFGLALSCSDREGAKSSNPLPPVCLSMPPLIYPTVADRWLEGDVIIRAWIDDSGRVRSAELQQSELPQPFVDEALRVALAARFSPPQGPKERRGARVAIPFHFHPRESPPVAVKAVDAAPVLTDEDEAVNPIETASESAGDEMTDPIVAIPESVGGKEEPQESDDREAAPSEVALGEATSGGGASSSETLPPLVELGLGRSIIDRILTDRDDLYQTDDRVYFWNRFAGAAPGDEFRHLWLLNGRLIQEIPVTLRQADWRTWSYKTLFPGLAGEWSVEVRRSDGELLGSARFICQPSPD